MVDLVKGMDVSSHQPRDLSALIREHQPEHIIVKLYQTIENIPAQYSIDQIHSAQANGCSVSGYVWLYHGVDPEQQVADALAVADLAGVHLPVLWIDLETYEGEGPTREEALAAVQACEAHEVQPGIYTGNWYVHDYWGGDVGELGSQIVWLADYNGVPDLNTPSPYWSTPYIVGHQYSDKPVDMDVFHPSAAGGAIASPPDESVPTPPDTDWLISTLGYASHDVPEGLEAEANRKGGPRKSQVLAIAEKLRTLSPT